MNTHESFVGIDVSKDWLDIAWLSGQTLRVEHSGEAIAGLIERLRNSRPRWSAWRRRAGLKLRLPVRLPRKVWQWPW
jgi:transposase